MSRAAASLTGIIVSVAVLMLAVVNGDKWTAGQVLGALFFIAGGLTPAACYLLGEDE
jgi:hypothetical protein